MVQVLRSSNANSERKEGSAGPTLAPHVPIFSKVPATKQVNKVAAQRHSHGDDGAWIEDPAQRHIVISQACQLGTAEYLQPLLECFEEHPHQQDFSITEMLHIAVEARNLSIICFLLKLAKRDGSDIDVSLRNAAFDAGFAVFNLFPKTTMEARDK